MKSLFFPSYSFDLKNPRNYSEVNYSFGVDYFVNDNNEYKVEVKVDISDSSNTLKISLLACGVFSVEENMVDGNMKDVLIRRNTVAIMFPYIRSQITLLTTQPGMNAIIMPPINVNALLDDLESKQKGLNIWVKSAKAIKQVHADIFHFNQMYNLPIMNWNGIVKAQDKQKGAKKDCSGQSSF